MRMYGFLLSLALCCFLGSFSAAADTVYLDGTGTTEGAYTTIWAAVDALPAKGGNVIVCGNTTVGTSKSAITLPEKSGKVVITGENGAKLMIAYGLKLGSETEIDRIELVNASTNEGFISAMGHKLTVGENVTTSREGTDRWLTIRGGNTVSDETATYDSHLIIRAGTWRYIFGGSKGIFNGNSTVQVSGITVGTLSAENERGAFQGTALLMVDLRGGKTVTANKYAQEPIVLTDDGYVAVRNGDTYAQVKAESGEMLPDATETICPGDMNGDGDFTIVDVLLALKMLLNEDVTESTDVNGDGKTSLADVLHVMKRIGLASYTVDWENKLYTIDELNTDNTPWSHVHDDIHTASLEISYRDTVKLGSELLAPSGTNAAHYPRVKKVKDDLYLLTYMQGQYGGEALYYTTSPDGKSWAMPAILWQGTDTVKGGRFLHTDGPLEGKVDSYIGVNPDFCVLQNGDILAVYYLRPKFGSNHPTYAPYQNFSGVHMKRGTVGADNTITWGEDRKLAYGRGWEPTVWQRPDGRVEIFWTNASTGLLRYEDAHWSSTGMIYSKDNGFTWTPDIESGLENEYLYLNIFQEVVGTHLPAAVHEDGTPWFTEPQPFAKGQMPSVTHLYNGKTLLATEVRPYNGSFHITLATSPKGGDWKHVEFAADATEITEAICGDASPTGAAPYVSTFPSGEVYLVYNQGLMQRGRLVRADGKEISMHEFSPTPAAYNAYWGACSVIGSHKALSTIHDTNFNIHIYTSYLNHRINAKKAKISVDGYATDWLANTDALFVGSESQAQATLRVAHDDQNVYFLISLLDAYLTSGDSVTVCVADTAVSDRRVTAWLNGKATFSTYHAGEKQTVSTLCGAEVIIKGTVNDNTDTDAGATLELAVPKEKLALGDASEMVVRLLLNNNDGDGTVTDTFDGVHPMYTVYWPKVVLD